MTSSSPQPSSITKLRELLSSTLRITVNDGRIFLGCFIGTDQPMNILLTDTEEFRIEPLVKERDGLGLEEEEDPNIDAETTTAGRFVGQVLIPWKIIRKIEVQEPMAPAQRIRTTPSFDHSPMEYVL
ncbi:hypothetical protein D9757_007298 [Collybiopsis confluens]|uniref:Sm domain-containing protein n=1 Tax=Collybiopsis confluens TaxID=2823264 RepID=A0A8H5HGR3_9AGAR|nr:hypothetical protein D9757_007298 [Collybiopsis confluens]